MMYVPRVAKSVWPSCIIKYSNNRVVKKSEPFVFIKKNVAEHITFFFHLTFAPQIMETLIKEVVRNSYADI